jgi:hypothetical protein
MGRPFVPAIPLPHVKRKAAAAAAAAAATTNATPPKQSPEGRKENHHTGEATTLKAELSVNVAANEHRGTQELLVDENANPTMNGEEAAQGEFPTQRNVLHDYELLTFIPNQTRTLPLLIPSRPQRPPNKSNPRAPSCMKLVQKT